MASGLNYQSAPESRSARMSDSGSLGPWEEVSTVAETWEQPMSVSWTSVTRVTLGVTVALAFVLGSNYMLLKFKLNTFFFLQCCVGFWCVTTRISHNYT